MTRLFLALLTVATLSGAACPARCECDDERLEALCEGAALEVVPIQLNPALVSMDLSRNRIDDVGPTLGFYPALRRLSLADNRVATLAERNLELQTSLVELNVSGNRVATLAGDAFRGLRALRVLDLGRNRLRRFRGGVLAHLPRLTHLYLARNSIDSIDDDAFREVVDLRLLDLSHNLLLDVPTPALRHLHSLQELWLDGNLLETLEADSLAAQGRLRDLRLRGNLLRRLHRAAMDALTSLASLDLAYNNLTSVPTAALASLSSLQTLDLSGNAFRSLHAVAFHSLFQLRRLRLCRLPALSRIDERAFVDNGKLESVFLEDNPLLQRLPPRLFQALTELSLRGCSLQTLDASLFSLRRLWLADNPFHCNCSLLWLWIVASSQRSGTNSSRAGPRLDVDFVRCASPEDTVLGDGAETLFRCEASWASVAVVAAVVGALFAVTCGLLLVIGNGKGCLHRDAVSAETPPPPPDADDASPWQYATLGDYL